MEIQKQIQEKIKGNPNLAQMVAESMGLERFTEAAFSLLSNPTLAKCSQESIFAGLLKAAMFNFRLSPELGQCWLIPRNIKTGKDEKGKDIYSMVATFQIGYKGWQELSFRSGEVESFASGMVYENDQFDFEMGTNAYLKHKPTNQNPGQRIWVWASATMKSGRVVFHVNDIQEVEKHRRASETQAVWNDATRRKELGAPTGIWAAWYDQMAKRVPMSYLCKLQLPKSEMLLKAIEADGSTVLVKDDGKEIEIGNGEVLELSEKTLHEDYILEITNCKTPGELKEIWEQRKGKFPDDETRTMYYETILSHHKTLANGSN